MTRTHIGLVGCGRWGRLIARDLKSLGCRLSVADTSEAGRANARDASADTIVAALQSLPAVDGIVVAVETTAHLAVVGQALDLGVPVFCEKPLGHDPAAARALARQAQVRLFVMHKWRYHPGVLELASIARDGRLGPVQALVSRRAGWGHAYPDVDASWILLPHEFSIALEILGALPTVTAAHASVAGHDLLNMIVFSTGDVAHLCEIDTRAPRRERRIELRCRDGVAALPDADAGHVEIVRNPAGMADSAQIERIAIETTQPLRRELAAFVGHVEGGPPPRSSMRDTVAILDAIARARELAGLVSNAPKP